MKTFIFASILILNASAICSKRSLNNCLKDEKCQIAQETCEIRPKNCEDINSTNPNNCGGIKCYYDYILKSCQPFSDIISNHFRVLDHDRHENSESQDDQHTNDHQDHDQKQFLNQQFKHNFKFIYKYYDKLYRYYNNNCNQYFQNC